MFALNIRGRVLFHRSGSLCCENTVVCWLLLPMAEYEDCNFGTNQQNAHDITYNWHISQSHTDIQTHINLCSEHDVEHPVFVVRTVIPSIRVIHIMHDLHQNLFNLGVRPIVDGLTIKFFVRYMFCFTWAVYNNQYMDNHRYSNNTYISMFYVSSSQFVTCVTYSIYSSYVHMYIWVFFVVRVL